jgi:RNA polymerase sigma-70 factor (ECF subfamily)
VVPDSSGDDAFREFYERLQTRAVAVARRLVGNPAIAEDLAAEAFARAYSRWPTVRTHPNPEAWLLRVVGNLAVDHVRHEARRPDLRDPGGRADRAGDDAALRVDLARALHRLSGRQQEVVVMRYLIDLTEEDVAVSLGMTTGSVKTHLHRATTKLRSQLAEDDLPAAVGTSGGDDDA